MSHLRGCSMRVSVVREKLELTRENLIAFVIDRRYVSFVQIQKTFQDTGGPCSLSLTGCDNIFLWFNMSLKLANLIEDIVSDKEVRLLPTSWLTYLADGKMVSFPVAKGRHEYKEPHWMPVVLDSIEEGSNGRV